jgi:phosphomannomutase
MLKFGTDGWRAVIADEFTFANLRLVTRAVARYLKDLKPAPSVVVGFDNRFMGADYAAAVAESMAADGVRVILGDAAYPTPTVAYAVREFAADGAVMLTASHNPYYYNGFKFIPEYAGPATGEITAAIERHIAEAAEGALPPRPEERAGIETKPLDAAYRRQILSFVDTGRIKAAGLTAGLDPYYGAGLSLFPALAREAGLAATVLHDTIDPLFGGTLPDPSEKNLTELKSLVLANGFDLGLALDGDADRFGVIAGDGRYLRPNQVVALLLLHMVKNRGAKGAVVRTVATTHLIDAVAAQYGVDVVETPVGFKHVGAVMRERPVIIGGEESGGLSVLGHIPEKDGLLANLLIAEMVALEGRSLAAIWDGVVDEFGEFLNTRLDLTYPLDKKDALLAKLTSAPPSEVGGFAVMSVDKKDGVKLHLAGGAWLLIRPSGTEPLIRAYIETRSRVDLTTLEAAAREMLKV